jgi:hypothetical protein
MPEAAAVVDRSLRRGSAGHRVNLCTEVRLASSAPRNETVIVISVCALSRPFVPRSCPEWPEGPVFLRKEASPTGFGTYLGGVITIEFRRAV